MYEHHFGIFEIFIVFAFLGLKNKSHDAPLSKFLCQIKNYWKIYTDIYQFRHKQRFMSNLETNKHRNMIFRGIML